jgi:hypothetical protein
MPSINGNYWAIVVKTKQGEVFAVQNEAPPPYQTFSALLCDSRKSAEVALSLGWFSPKGEARIVPVVVEMRELSKEERQLLGS